ncbi:MAG TPA: hypothetical protein GX707_08020 [Epulopiscium sp.]|nr:hypothetical protein [Candidatus Epulonipiscium sp.]
MDNIIIIGSYNKENEIYKIDFPDNSQVSINTENDIDLTDFVKKLTQMLSDNKKVVLNCEKQDDPKLNIFINTLNEIITSFNASLDELVLDIAAE